MHRRKPSSARKKKEEQKLRKAIKRGDLEPPPKPTRTQKKKGHLTRSVPTAAGESSKKLQSAFVKLPTSFLQQALSLASSLVLHRPIPKDASIFLDEDVDPSLDVLTCPKRPPWNFDMSKNEVEKGEEAVFRKWLAQTDKMVQQWQDLDKPPPPPADAEVLEDPTPEPILTSMPRSITYFERNIEVWRQLYVDPNLNLHLFNPFNHLGGE